MSFRDSIAAICPPWLLEHVGVRLGYTMGIILDAYSDQVREGIKARFPGIGTFDALPALGRDRDIERSPYEADEAYAERLGIAFETWQSAGSARAILTQLRQYFTPTDGPVMRTVFSTNSSKSVWHEIEPTTTGVVTKTVRSLNWNWDGLLTRYWRGWVLIEGQDLWTIDRWDAGGVWGDGGVWGSNMTFSDATSFKRIIRKWKDAQAWGKNLIITFDAGLFDRTDNSPPNPNGEMADYEVRIPMLANFSEAIHS